MNEQISIPKPVANFIQAINDQDAEAFRSTFANHAVVDDVGREFRGAKAIEEWGDREIFAANVTLDVIDAVEREGKTVVTVKVDGTFDRTGLPDPLFMDQSFMIVGDKIASLSCRLAGERPEK